jgi:hypothetical protein
MQKFNQFEMSLIARAVATIRQESAESIRARQVLADYGLDEKTARLLVKNFRRQKRKDYD